MHTASLFPLLTQLSCEPILIRSDCAHLPHLLAQRAVSAPRAAERAAAQEGLPETKPWEQREQVTLLPGGVAVISVRGMLCAGLDPITAWYWDVCRPEAIQAAVAAVAARSDVQVLVLDFHSPGGYTTAIPETAALIARLSQVKPTVAFTAGMMCSAAYWLGSQCTRIVAAPSATVGSIGTYAVVYDLSRYFEEEGVATHVIRAGWAKGIAIPGDKVTEQQLAFLQASVDRTNAAFLAAVRAGRGELPAEELQGQWYPGELAVAKGFADATALNRAELLATLGALTAV